MIKVGIGVTTYNRSKSLIQLLESIVKYTSIPYTLFCAVDGSKDNTVSALIDNNIEFTHGPNLGPSQNKNRIFRRFCHYNYIIIIEDDMLINDPKWVETLILAHSLTNIDFLGYMPKKDEAYAETKSFNVGSIRISILDKFKPKVYFYTRKVIERVGGIDDRIIGYEHNISDHYIRMVNNKVLPPIAKDGFINLCNLDNMIINNPDHMSVTSNDIKSQHIKKNNEIVDDNAINKKLFKNL